MDAAGISQQISDKENEILKAEENKDKIEEEINHIRWDIDKLRVRVRENQQAQIKVNAIVRELKHQHKELTRKFWSTKNSGI